MGSIDDIAAQAGVSVTTVSMVLNGKGDRYRISKATQGKVEALARELNYAPHPAARNLRTRRTQTIGFVITDLTNPFFSELAKELERVCRHNGYLLQLSDSGDREDIEEEIIRRFAAKAVDGLVIATSHKDVTFLADIARQIPTVFVDRKVEGEHCSWIATNNYGAAYEVTSHLVATSPREVAFIGGEPGLSSNAERLRGFRDALAAGGVLAQEPLILCGSFAAATGRRNVERLLVELGRRPDALFTASYTLLEGALSALVAAFGKVPSDMQIATFDDHPLLDYVAPPITSVRQDCRALASRAFDALQSQMAGVREGACHELPAQVLIRN